MGHLGERGYGFAEVDGAADELSRLQMAGADHFQHGRVAVRKSRLSWVER